MDLVLQPTFETCGQACIAMITRKPIEEVIKDKKISGSTSITDMILIREILHDELHIGLFADFRRHQEVTQCWRKVNGKWIIIENRFTEDWAETEFAYQIKCLCNTIITGGVVYGAFLEGKLKGFVSVESVPLGSQNQYLELSSIHVSEDCRGSGIGRKLMDSAKEWARKKGTEKLYISAHSSIESQAFYKAMGCCEAEEYSQPHVEKEPCDCQLEVSV